MKKDSTSGLGFMEGRAYTIGRDGHIRIDDASLSRGHAEIKFIEGKILLRDLGSTNGTYLLASNKFIGINESFVTPDQRIAVGSGHYTVKELLAKVGVYASYSDQSGLIVKLATPDKKPVTRQADLDELVSQSISRLFD